MRSPVNIAIANSERRNRGVGGKNKNVHDGKSTASSKKASITPLASSTVQPNASIETGHNSSFFDSSNGRNSPFPFIVDLNPNPVINEISHKSTVG